MAQKSIQAGRGIKSEYQITTTLNVLLTSISAVDTWRTCSLLLGSKFWGVSVIWNNVFNGVAVGAGDMLRAEEPVSVRWVLAGGFNGLIHGRQW